MLPAVSLIASGRRPGGLLQLFTTAHLSCSLFVRKLVACTGLNLLIASFQLNTSYVYALCT